jgi:hypothetical protein
MEQLDTKINATLSEEEQKNVFLSVACGCLTTIKQGVPGPEHLKKKRVLQELRDDILDYVSRRIPGIKQGNIKLFTDTIEASGKVMDQINEEQPERNSTHIMLNLAGFCLDKLPLAPKHFRKYNALFELWEGAYKYEDTRAGDRIFNRIESELKILLAQRSGALL